MKVTEKKGIRIRIYVVGVLFAIIGMIGFVRYHSSFPKEIKR